MPWSPAIWVAPDPHRTPLSELAPNREGRRRLVEAITASRRPAERPPMSERAKARRDRKAHRFARHSDYSMA